MTRERRIPTQARSRAKYDKILETAKKLIGEQGNDSVSMREIAKQAELPISSIYQYFPGKNAILAAIMQFYFDDVRGFINEFCSCCCSLEDVNKGIDSGIDLFFDSLKKDPALATMWAGLQANTELKELDAEDSQVNAELIAKLICSIIPNSQYDEVFHATLLLIHTAGMTVRLALDMPEKDAEKYVEEFKKITALRLKELVR